MKHTRQTGHETDPSPTYEALWQLSKADPEITATLFGALAHSSEKRLRMAAAFLVEDVLSGPYGAGLMPVVTELCEDPVTDVREMAESMVRLSRLP